VVVVEEPLMTLTPQDPSVMVEQVAVVPQAYPISPHHRRRRIPAAEVNPVFQEQLIQEVEEVLVVQALDAPILAKVEQVEKVLLY
jgi:hypothetical protein